jgi:hypothetical protein
VGEHDFRHPQQQAASGGHEVPVINSKIISNSISSK